MLCYMGYVRLFGGQCCVIWGMLDYMEGSVVLYGVC